MCAGDPRTNAILLIRGIVRTYIYIYMYNSRSSLDSRKVERGEKPGVLETARISPSFTRGARFRGVARIWFLYRSKCSPRNCTKTKSLSFGIIHYSTLRPPPARHPRHFTSTLFSSSHFATLPSQLHSPVPDARAAESYIGETRRGEAKRGGGGTREGRRWGRALAAQKLNS